MDFIHVAQYVWQAALAFHPADPENQDAWVRTRLLEILRGKAGYVAGGMRRSATRQSMTTAERKPVDDCADYLLHYAPYLRYDKALAAGLPIATGVVEGACRHLVNDRMNVTGARWSLEGAEAVLHLRALRSSADFDDYWEFHEIREYERNHAARYADQQVPATVPPRAIIVAPQSLQVETRQKVRTVSAGITRRGWTSSNQRMQKSRTLSILQPQFYSLQSRCLPLGLLTTALVVTSDLIIPRHERAFCCRRSTSSIFSSMVPSSKT